MVCDQGVITRSSEETIGRRQRTKRTTGIHRPPRDSFHRTCDSLRDLYLSLYKWESLVSHLRGSNIYPEIVGLLHTPWGSLESQRAPPWKFSFRHPNYESLSPTGSLPGGKELTTVYSRTVGTLLLVKLPSPSMTDVIEGKTSKSPSREIPLQILTRSTVSES